MAHPSIAEEVDLVRSQGEPREEELGDFLADLSRLSGSWSSAISSLGEKRGDLLLLPEPIRTAHQSTRAFIRPIHLRLNGFTAVLHLLHVRAEDLQLLWGGAFRSV